MIPVVKPAKADGTMPVSFDKNWIGEEKIDGSRYVLYLGSDPYNRHSGHTMLSRHESKHDQMFVDRSENVPHITNRIYPGLDGCVLDGEIVSSNFLNTNSIMNSLPSEAIEKQKKMGLLSYKVFDICFYLGQDVRSKPLSERRRLLEIVVGGMGNPQVTAIPWVTQDLEKYFDQIVNAGGEGIIVKDVRQAYGQSWVKMKKSYDVSTIITGFKKGKGKYADTIGSVAVSVYDGPNLIEVSFVSGFPDKMRREMGTNFAAYAGRVVDVFAQEIQKGRLRHATFHRFRDDVAPIDCTKEKLIADLRVPKAQTTRLGREEKAKRIKHKQAPGGKRGSADQWAKAAQALMLGLTGMSTHLDTLGLVKMPDDLQTLKKARNDAIRKAHPDMAGGSHEAATAINQAFEALKKLVA